MTSRTSGQHPHGALTVHDGQMVKRVLLEQQHRVLHGLRVLQDHDLMGHQLAHSTGAAGVVSEDAHRQPCEWLGPVAHQPFSIGSSPHRLEGQHRLFAERRQSGSSSSGAVGAGADPRWRIRRLALMRVDCTSSGICSASLRLMPRSFVSPSGTSQAPQLRQTVTPPARGLSFTGLSQFGHGASVCPSIATPSFRPDIGQAVSMPGSTV